ncbi:MAG: preprotein translocase subunit SecG [Azoarcus sp.]|jgi:preprotein translocase subunit SecG|nr:preprotein translocase subunit SecG [Azoarcus sp.]
MGNSFFPFVLTIHVLAGLAVIGLVLVQHGKGADMGAAFGSGASGSLFGASGSANFLSRTTAALATVFFVTSLSLSYLAGKTPAAPKSIMDEAPAVVEPAAISPDEASPSPDAAASAGGGAADAPPADEGKEAPAEGEGVVAPVDAIPEIPE